MDGILNFYGTDDLEEEKEHFIHGPGRKRSKNGDAGEGIGGVWQVEGGLASLLLFSLGCCGVGVELGVQERKEGCGEVP